MNSSAFLSDFHHVATIGATHNNGVDRQAATAEDAQPGLVCRLGARRRGNCAWTASATCSGCSSRRPARRTC